MAGSKLSSRSIVKSLSLKARIFIVALGIVGLSGCATQTSEEVPELDAQSRLQTKTRVADSARASGDYQTAIRLYQGLVKEYPEELSLHTSLANTLVDAQAFDDSLTVFNAALKLAEGEEAVPVLNGAGRAYLSLNQPDQALRYFNQALTKIPDDIVARNGKAVVLDQLGRHGEAQGFYRSLIDDGNGNPAVRNNLALSLILTADYEEAITLLTNLSRSPYSTEKVRQNLALALGLSGDTESARKVAGVDLDYKAVENNIRFYELLRGQTSGSSGQIGGPVPPKPAGSKKKSSGEQDG